MVRRQVLAAVILRLTVEPGNTEAALHSFVAHAVSGSPTKNQKKYIYIYTFKPWFFLF
jgi:hypothetical protein